IPQFPNFLYQLPEAPPPPELPPPNPLKPPPPKLPPEPPKPPPRKGPTPPVQPLHGPPPQYRRRLRRLLRSEKMIAMMIQKISPKGKCRGEEDARRPRSIGTSEIVTPRFSAMRLISRVAPDSSPSP